MRDEPWRSTTMTLNVFHDVQRVDRMYFLEKMNTALQNPENHKGLLNNGDCHKLVHFLRYMNIFVSNTRGWLKMVHLLWYIKDWDIETDRLRLRYLYSVPKTDRLRHWVMETQRLRLSDWDWDWETETLRLVKWDWGTETERLRLRQKDWHWD